MSDGVLQKNELRALTFKHRLERLKDEIKIEIFPKKPDLVELSFLIVIEDCTDESLVKVIGRWTRVSEGIFKKDRIQLKLEFVRESLIDRLNSQSLHRESIPIVAPPPPPKRIEHGWIPLAPPHPPPPPSPHRQFPPPPPPPRQSPPPPPHRTSSPQTEPSRRPTLSSSPSSLSSASFIQHPQVSSHFVRTDNEPSWGMNTDWCFSPTLPSSNKLDELRPNTALKRKALDTPTSPIDKPSTRKFLMNEGKVLDQLLFEDHFLESPISKGLITESLEALIWKVKKQVVVFYTKHSLEVKSSFNKYQYLIGSKAGLPPYEWNNLEALDPSLLEDGLALVHRSRELAGTMGLPLGDFTILISIPKANSKGIGKHKDFQKPQLSPFVLSVSVGGASTLTLFGRNGEPQRRIHQPPRTALVFNARLIEHGVFPGDDVNERINITIREWSPFENVTNTTTSSMDSGPSVDDPSDSNHDKPGGSKRSFPPTKTAQKPLPRGSNNNKGGTNESLSSVFSLNNCMAGQPPDTYPSVINTQLGSDTGSFLSEERVDKLRKKSSSKDYLLSITIRHTLIQIFRAWELSQDIDPLCFPNLGNTCYLGSFLLGLFSCIEFTSLLVSSPLPPLPNPNGSSVYRGRIFGDLYSHFFLLLASFPGSIFHRVQTDTGDTLRDFLRILDFCSDSDPFGIPKLEQVFMTSFQSTILCEVCKSSRRTDEDSTSLTINLPQIGEHFLEDLLDLGSVGSPLDELVYCRGCGAKTKSSVTSCHLIEMSSFIVHLGRTSKDGLKSRASVVFKLALNDISFHPAPSSLPPSNNTSSLREVFKQIGSLIRGPPPPRRKGFNLNGKTFKLCGVILHEGKESVSGHLLGMTLQKDGRWIEFDDSNKRFIGPCDVLNKSTFENVCVLFYSEMVTQRTGTSSILSFWGKHPGIAPSVPFSKVPTGRNKEQVLHGPGTRISTPAKNTTTITTKPHLTPLRPSATINPWTSKNPVEKLDPPSNTPWGVIVWGTFLRVLVLVSSGGRTSSRKDAAETLNTLWNQPGVTGLTRMNFNKFGHKWEEISSILSCLQRCEKVDNIPRKFAESFTRTLLGNPRSNFDKLIGGIPSSFPPKSKGNSPDPKLFISLGSVVSINFNRNELSTVRLVIDSRLHSKDELVTMRNESLQTFSEAMIDGSTKLVIEEADLRLVDIYEIRKVTGPLIGGDFSKLTGPNDFWTVSSSRIHPNSMIVTGLTRVRLMELSHVEGVFCDHLFLQTYTKGTNLPENTGTKRTTPKEVSFRQF